MVPSSGFSKPLERVDSFDPPVAAYRIDLSSWQEMQLMGGLGLDLVEMRPLHHAVAIGWPGTLEKLRLSGLNFVQVSENLGQDLADRSSRELALKPEAGPPRSEGSVPPFANGSMVGFWTYNEVMALLDNMSRQDAGNILTACDTLGYSIEGRPIVAIGLFNQERPPGTRPEVLLTALTHSREPMSMQAVLYFLSHMIENYGRDPDVTYLVDEREIWFVPVVNPDGYVRNENTWRETGGFGFWRKNLRDNDGDGMVTMGDGVDLNRNFGFRWGFDDYGSSPHAASQVYRGGGPFSEPETQALRDFCMGHAFVTANNVHAYYEATLYPWGHAPEDTPDAASYVRLVDQVTKHNGYAYGFSDQVLYPVNGDADDWLYGDQILKPKCYSMTSEIGSLDDGFWPPPSRIRALAQKNLHSFMTLVYGAGDMLRAKTASVTTGSGFLLPGTRGQVSVEIANLGVGSGSSTDIRVQAVSLHPYVSVVEEELRVPTLGRGESVLAGQDLVLWVSPEAAPGMRVPLVFSFSDDRGYSGSDTLSILVGRFAQVFEDDGSRGLRYWVPSGLWGQETVQGNRVFSDSPGSNYPNSCDASLTLVSGLDLTGGLRASLSFRTQWNIEKGYDFGLVEVSPDSGATWIPLAGQWTAGGKGNSGPYAGGIQPRGLPGYQGNSRLWKTEIIDLSSYAGHPDLRLRFRLTADTGLAQEGWLIDDILVATYDLGEAQSPSPRPGPELLEAAIPPESQDRENQTPPKNHSSSVGVH